MSAVNFKKIAKDGYLFREGDAPDAMYIVKSGELAITKTKGNSEIVLAELKPGQMLGEMALFDKKPRSANVKALKDSEVVTLPYDSLESQLESLPVWVKAIMKTMNENIRESNKKIKMLETTSQEEERFSAHVINKLLTIINFIGHKYGTKEGDLLILPQNRLRNFTIQIFQEATNKMQSVLGALKELGYFELADLGEGKQRIVNLKPDFLFSFVDWYNDWLFKQEKDRMPALTAEDIKILTGVIHFAKKAPAGPKGLRKININDIQNESMKEIGYLIKVDEINPLIEKKILSEKIMEEGGVFITIMLDDYEPIFQYWKLIWDLKKILR